MLHYVTFEDGQFTKYNVIVYLYAIILVRQYFNFIGIVILGIFLFSFITK